MADMLVRVALESHSRMKRLLLRDNLRLGLAAGAISAPDLLCAGSLLKINS
jgi:hypothetical protein